jgi:hypothetical protein
VDGEPAAPFAAGRTFTVPGHDHSLEFVSWAVTGNLPQGLNVLFEQVGRF